MTVTVSVATTVTPDFTYEGVSDSRWRYVDDGDWCREGWVGDGRVCTRDSCLRRTDDGDSDSGKLRFRTRYRQRSVGVVVLMGCVCTWDS